MTRFWISIRQRLWQSERRWRPLAWSPQRRFAPGIVKKVWSAGHRQGYARYFLYSEGGSITDDHVNVNRILGIPCIDIINYDPNSPNGFGAHHHTMKDDMDWISPATLKAVGQTVMSVIYSEK